MDISRRREAAATGYEKFKKDIETEFVAEPELPDRGRNLPVAESSEIETSPLKSDSNGKGHHKKAFSRAPK